MHNQQYIYTHATSVRYRGSALLMSIVLTMMLFIVGFAFLLDTQNALESSESIDSHHNLESALDKVIDQINKRLSEDIDDYHNGEVYDYPGEDDRWLASLEPAIWGVEPIGGANIYYWPHITDLWHDWEKAYKPFPEVEMKGSNVVLKYDPTHRFVPYYDPDDYNNYGLSDINYDQWLQPLSTTDYTNPRRYWVTAYNTIARIVAADDPIEDVLRDNVNGSGSGEPWRDSVRNPDFPHSAPPDLTKPRYSYATEPPLTLPHGHRADADGDGVVDARWHRMDETVDDQGQYIYAAVRIIDNSAMLNLNTAYKDPTADGIDWDGAKLTDIDIESLVPTNYIKSNHLHGFRETGLTNDNSATINAQVYHDGVARRLGNPSFNMYKYGLSDEAELRTGFIRNNLDITTEIEMVWPALFDVNPLRFYGGNSPYVLADAVARITNTGGIHNWYNEVTDDYTNGNHWIHDSTSATGYNHRHIVTTVSKTREFRPLITKRLNYNSGTGQIESEDNSEVTTAQLTSLGMAETLGMRKFDINLPVALPDGTPVDLSDGIDDSDDQTAFNTYIQQLAGAIYRGIHESNGNDMQNTPFEHLGDGSPMNDDVALAWQYALNIFDYQDDDQVGLDNPSYYTTGGYTFFGFENGMALLRDTLQITKVAARNFEGVRYRAIELYNPSGADKQLNIFSIKVGSKAPVTLPDGIISGYGYHVLLDADIDRDEALIKIALGDARFVGTPDKITRISIPTTGSILFNNLDVIEIFKPNHPESTVSYPVESITVPGDSLFEINATPKYMERSRTIKVLGGAAKLFIDSTVVADIGLFWRENSSANLGGDAALSDESLNPLFPTEIRMYSSDTSLKTIGELGNIFAVGSWRATDGSYAKPFMKNLNYTIGADEDDEPQSEGSIENPDSANDLPNQNFGRLNFSNNRYRGIFDYLTLSDPSSDGIDNDGKMVTNDDPGGDGLDNNFNSAFDEAAEASDPALYEHVVSGKININTAPWKVIQRLPWLKHLVDDSSGDPDDPSTVAEKKQSGNLAMAIVAYRDKLDLTALNVLDSTVWPYAPNYSDTYDTSPAGISTYALQFEGRWSENDGAGQAIPTAGVNLRTDINVKRGFKNIAEITHVRSNNFASDRDVQEFDIRKYLEDGGNTLTATPPHYDQSPINNANDFLERDILFQRISNLITVRSDVFTAYILLRYGKNGPQRRYLVVFDRSNVINVMADGVTRAPGADTPDILLKQLIEAP